MAKVRYNITLPSKFEVILDSISDHENISKAEVIRKALVLYDYLFREAIQQNNRIVIQNRTDEKEKEVVFA